MTQVLDLLSHSWLDLQPLPGDFRSLSPARLRPGSSLRTWGGGLPGSAFAYEPRSGCQNDKDPSYDPWHREGDAAHGTSTLRINLGGPLIEGSSVIRDL